MFCAAENVGRAEIISTGTFDEDLSHYCNLTAADMDSDVDGISYEDV